MNQAVVYTPSGGLVLRESPPKILQKIAQILDPGTSGTFSQPTRILHPVWGGMCFFFFVNRTFPRSAPLWVFPGEVGEPGTLEYRMHFKDGTDGTDGPWSLVGVLWWLDDLGGRTPNKNGGGVFWTFFGAACLFFGVFFAIGFGGG